MQQHTVRLPGEVYAALFEAFYGAAPPVTKKEVWLPVGEYRQMAWAYGGEGPTFTQLNNGTWRTRIHHAKQEQQPKEESDGSDEESERVAQHAQHAAATDEQWRPPQPTLRRMTPEEVAAMADDGAGEGADGAEGVDPDSIVD